MNLLVSPPQWRYLGSVVEIPRVDMEGSGFPSRITEDDWKGREVAESAPPIIIFSRIFNPNGFPSKFPQETFFFFF